ncbi:MAG: hypothetical protein AUJ85_06465 [Elusimicrobia bacterium CG1_02_37_114]|nr:MAG: hypothetical protein AUJ85_06465 [Elusimicrobia bacterium CG1_02_37_114]PIV54137.1 MAG: segregation/condensation protein A [Elusimicrobia bacterium CG02_land_8_20_14_3_00_37_13]PIZ13049.1 MAG: segregation/condensation protein A [Elusimicrobia bacterium CG_4_10_14_0_8_um_filter_37_32]
MNQKTYDVHLEVFEGPLDLLLFLIRKNDMDIYDIPVSQITAEYLDYISVMKELNLDIAGEFLVMAATLMQIKSKTMLPSPAVEEETGPDPREELVQRLLEYQKYKQVAQFLSSHELDEQGVYYKSMPVLSEEDYLLEATIFDLIECFRGVLKELPGDVKEIVYEEIPIEQKIREILDLLEDSARQGRKYISFKDILIREIKRIGAVVSFLAILELIRLKQIVARQSKLFGEIRIYPVTV